MLKKLSIAFLLAALACTITGWAFAQSHEGNGPQSAQAGEQSENGWGRGDLDPAKRTEMLTQQLKLTSDQQPKMLAILKSEQSQMQKLRSDRSLSQNDGHPQIIE